MKLHFEAWTGTIALQMTCLCTAGCHRPWCPMDGGPSMRPHAGAGSFWAAILNKAPRQ